MNDPQLPQPPAPPGLPSLPAPVIAWLERQLIKLTAMLTALMGGALDGSNRYVVWLAAVVLWALEIIFSRAAHKARGILSETDGPPAAGLMLAPIVQNDEIAAELEDIARDAVEISALLDGGPDPAEVIQAMRKASSIRNRLRASAALLNPSRPPRP